MIVRLLLMIEVVETDNPTLDVLALTERAIRESGRTVVGISEAYELDAQRFDPLLSTQHYRPQGVCASCGWPFTDHEGEVYCLDCASVLTDGDQFRRLFPQMKMEI